MLDAWNEGNCTTIECSSIVVIDGCIKELITCLTKHHGGTLNVNLNTTETTESENGSQIGAKRGHIVDTGKPHCRAWNTIQQRLKPNTTNTFRTHNQVITETNRHTQRL